jgi:hypothetical protein
MILLPFCNFYCTGVQWSIYILLGLFALNLGQGIGRVWPLWCRGGGDDEDANLSKSAMVKSKYVAQQRIKNR